MSAGSPSHHDTDAFPGGDSHDGGQHTSPRPATSGATSHLNSRSCVTCRKRKVRCNKVEPSCENCSKAGISCIYPAPGRAPRKPRRPPDAELLKRLRRLEGVVQGLGAQVDDDTYHPLSPESPADKLVHNSTGQALRNNSTNRGRCPLEIQAGLDEFGELPLGKLVISQGKSRYVNNSYWATISNEISDIRDILDQSDSGDDHDNSPDQLNGSGTSAQHAFIFGFSSLTVNMDQLRPSPSQIFIIWDIFKENVDPVVKILHGPTLRNLILKAAVNMDTISRPAEALFFAVCFAAVVSMAEDQCQSLLGDSKTALWRKYRFAMEQSLARADFMNSSSLLVLQAFTFYLICVRFYDDSKSVWAMGGLAIQIGYTLGLHRDGAHFGLDPFETEMRRRLWWHIALLDVRAAEDHGAEIRTPQAMYDTKFPSNVNDENIWPGMAEPPVEKTGPTEMTLCLIRFELSAMTRKLNLYSPDTCLVSEQAITAKEKMIDECHRQLEEKYIRGCDMQVPIHWVAATVSRLILAKMWLKLHHLRLSKDLSRHPDLRDRVFTTSVEVIEFGHLLESNDNTAKWGWLFRTYMQWHAVAYVLSELAVRPSCTATERAWKAIELVYEESIHAKRQRGMLWKPIRQLMVKAKAHRAKIMQTQADASADIGTDEQWVAGNRSAVASAADALGLDLSNEMVPSRPHDGGAATTINFDEFEPANINTQNYNIGEPDQMQYFEPHDSTPDYFSWQGWSPGLGDFSLAAQPSQNFDMDFNKVQQEWF